MVELTCIVTVTDLLDVLFTTDVKDADIAVEFFVVNFTVVFGAIVESDFKVVVRVVFVFDGTVAFMSVAYVVSSVLRVVWGFIV